MISKLIRRTHMYSALFLVPWIVMYALSTMAMNHRQDLAEWFNEDPVRYEEEREVDYIAVFDEGVPTDAVAREVLSYLDMEGRFSARGNIENRITINRHDLLYPKQITYIPDERVVRIEKKIRTVPNWLEEMHRRRGFGSGYLKEDIWAFIVDVVIVAIIGWVLSGLWMWWELKVTRKWGAVFLIFGIVLFSAFLILI